MPAHQLREEQLVARKETRERGTVKVRTEIEHMPGRLEVDAYREEVEVEHEPVGEVVTERVQPWKEDDGALVVPIYEEELVVSTQLVLRERIRIRTVATTERRLFEKTLRRERLVVEDPDHTGRVRELYQTAHRHLPIPARPTNTRTGRESWEAGPASAGIAFGDHKARGGDSRSRAHMPWCIWRFTMAHESEVSVSAAPGNGAERITRRTSAETAPIRRYDTTHIADSEELPRTLNIAHDRVRWGAIIAGLLTALTALLVLNLLGLAVGLTTVNAAQATAQGGAPSDLGRNAGIWAAISGLLAFLLGGYVAAGPPPCSIMAGAR